MQRVVSAGTSDPIEAIGDITLRLYTWRNNHQIAERAARLPAEVERDIERTLGE